jgi:hypothetical protein
MVRIVSPGSCVYGSNKEMRGLTDYETAILSCDWDSSHRTYQYRLEIDNGRWVWSDKCIAPAGQDIEESDESIDILLGGAAV